MKAVRVVLSCSFLVSIAIAPSIAHAGSKTFKNGTVTVVLDSPISTSLNKVGDSFVARVTQPADIEGAIMEGHIRKLEPAKEGNAPKSHIIFGFETLTVGDTTYKIEATLKEVANAKGVKKVDEEGEVLAQGNGMKRALFGAGGAGLGALAGGMIGGGVGSLVGGLAGGALGYVVSLDCTASGKNIDFFPGSTFVLDVNNKGVNKDVNAADVRNLDASAITAQQKSTPPPNLSATAPTAGEAAQTPGGAAPETSSSTATQTASGTAPPETPASTAPQTPSGVAPPETPAATPPQN
jgi:hypothetical protein